MSYCDCLSMPVTVMTMAPDPALTSNNVTTPSDDNMRTTLLPVSSDDNDDNNAIHNSNTPSHPHPTTTTTTLIHSADATPSVTNSDADTAQPNCNDIGTQPSIDSDAPSISSFFLSFVCVSQFIG